MKNRSIELSAPAKLNLFLEVTGVRPDGMHLVETVMQTIDLCDHVELAPCPVIRCRCDLESLPTDERNLCVRAAQALKERFRVDEGVDIRLAKRIPVGRGLGGGSSDAAAVLVGLARLWGLTAGREELCKVAEELGADVPFFVFGGTCLCRGMGEEVIPLPGAVPREYLLCIPPIQVSTKQVYENLRLNLTNDARSPNNTIGWLCDVDKGTSQRGIFNRLEKTAFEQYPELSGIKKVLNEAPGFGWRMSGSGSAFFSPVGKSFPPELAEAVSRLGCELLAARTFAPMNWNAKG